MINAMHYITVGVFEDLDNTSKIDLYKSIKYTECIIKESAMKTYIIGPVGVELIS